MRSLPKLLSSHFYNSLGTRVLAVVLSVVLVACGGGGGSTILASALNLFAGNTNNVIILDGAGPLARFANPAGVATDANGNVYVADFNNHTIRRITPEGVVTTLAGSAGEYGSDDGIGTIARFDNPASVATDGNGNLYVADFYNHTIRKIVIRTGEVSTLAGTAGEFGSEDGIGAIARFDGPMGVATDASGNVYVADSNNNTIRKINSAGVVTTLAGTAGESGSEDGTGAIASFNFPAGIAIHTNNDGSINVYIADRDNDAIRKIVIGTGQVSGVVTTLTGTAGFPGRVDGNLATASFNYPSGVATDTNGNVYVADRDNDAIRKIDVGAGQVTTLAGTAGITGTSDGTGTSARFNFPSGVVADRIGNVYVADYYNNTIRKITLDSVVTTLAGNAVPESADGTGAAASFNAPAGVAADASGNVFVADQYNHTIRMITPEGVVTTLAGRLGQPGSDDGTGVIARFDNPTGVATDGNGNLYVADLYNHTIRKIVISTGEVSTLAGTAGSFGSVDGTGATARFDGPVGVATDASGNVYVADSNNNTIRKITSAGVVTTMAGTAGVSGSDDGAGAVASFNFPAGVSSDNNGNVYVADSNNQTIRKINLRSGQVSTLAGKVDEIGIADGTGSAASFNYPSGIATDYNGNVYVADLYNYTIRKITPEGKVTTLAGTAGVSDFKPGALPGVTSPNLGIAVSGSKIFFSMNNFIAVIN